MHRGPGRRHDGEVAAQLLDAVDRRWWAAASARAILSLGIAHCPEGRHVFPQMTVLENLEMGCYLRSDRRQIAAGSD